mgnify:FL=1
MKSVLMCATVLVAAVSLAGCGGTAAPAVATATTTPAASTSAASTAPTTNAPPAADGIDGTGIAAKMVMALVKAGSGRYDMVSSGAAGGQQVTMTAKSEFVVVNGAMDSKATMSVAGG